ncbi:MAG TPA: amidohydrolase family protein [Candidatus Lustribacter sp.]|jgi:predicted TIM-barrel fold metal-dependent hydrolase|nr:amidohydrolase family protein [Candidatus Lustribacter sp.]
MNMMHPEVVVTEARSLAALKEPDAATRAALDALPGLFSTDSHVMEPHAIWQDVPAAQRETVNAWLSEIGFRADKLPAGAGDPHARLLDQQRDGVVAEILFPNDGMTIFGLPDPLAQQAAFTAYNNWLAAFCKTAPNRFFGVTALSVYDIDAAVRELHRGLDIGLIGGMVWQVPDPQLPFSSRHYDPLWAAAAEAGAPIHMHILTGHSYALRQRSFVGAEKIRGAVNKKQDDTINALFDLIFSGVFDRHRELKVVLAESECGWLPFVLQQWDYYFERFRHKEPMGIERRPSEIFFEHVYCTWLEDYSGTRQFSWWGQDNLMWSNDYPHFNMTFPYSRANVLHHIGNLPANVQRKLIRDNAIRLYGLAARLEEKIA